MRRKFDLMHRPHIKSSGPRNEISGIRTITFSLNHFIALSQSPPPPFKRPSSSNSTSSMSHSFDTKSTSIAVPDRGSFATGHQQCYLSPPLTPYPHFHSSHDSLDSISPVLAPYHTALPALQEMLPHDRRQRKSARDLGPFHSPSASQHHRRRESKEILESSTSAIYTGGQVANDPARLLPMYPTENHVTVPPPATIVSPMLRRNKAHVASACVNCKKAHLACEGIYSSPITSNPLAALSIATIVFAASCFPPPPHRVSVTLMAECGCTSTLRLCEFSDYFLFTFLFCFISSFAFIFVVFFIFCIPGKTGRGRWEG